MLILYTTTSSLPCRQTKAWLKKRKINFKEIKVKNGTLEKGEILELLSLSNMGTNEIISSRSKPYKRLGASINEFTLSELAEYIKDNPSILRLPILIDQYRIQVGYNQEEIRQFIPKEHRILKRILL